MSMDLGQGAVATDRPQAEQPVPLRRNRRFQLLWGGAASAMLGTCVADTAYPLLLLAMTGSASLAGAFGAVQFASSAVFGLHGGSLADRHDRCRILLAADGVRLLAALSVVAAMALHHLTVPHTLLVAAVLGATMAYGGPVRMLAIRSVVPPEQLRQALAQDELRVNGSALLGPPLAGFLFGLGGAVPFLTTALTSLLALTAAGAVRFESPTAEGRGERGGVLDGLRHLFSAPLLRSTLLVTLALNLTGSAMLLAVMVMLRNGGTSSTGTGFALAGEAVGGLLGAPLVTRLHRRLAPGALLLSVGWLGVVLFLVPAAVGGPVAVFCSLAAMTLGVPSLRVMVDVLIFQRVPDELRGRVIAATMTVLMVGLPIGTFVSGLLLDHLAPQAVLVLFAGVLALGLLPATLGRSLRGTAWPV
ncbi:MFS transporter [Kitasatospora paracochleata]|uniref:MFS family permease n=1 Tax=Kitasatospora paracochleata TaxID=58354 RepID=A0ABT1IWS6_9ACTN|nr:MFS transporter [Kitasatospora paracochleata]MCP2309595.1 MFS family permease [Kitasatospora paracochleata]